MPRKVCVVTGSRADYGLLYWPMRRIAEDADLTLQVAVTGMHLTPEFGGTWRRIAEDGFRVDAKVEMQVAGEGAVAVAKSIGLGVIGFADALDRLAPDLLMVLGDRYEILAAVEAALVLRIPVVHLCGGDTTEGAFDEAIRHAITKMAHIHCVTNAQSAARVRQLGEDPARVVVTGSPGLDHLSHFVPPARDELFAQLGLPVRQRLLLVTYHPVTLQDTDCDGEALDALLSSLDGFDPASTAIMLTGANADTGGAALNRRLEEFAAARAHVAFRVSLGQRLYFAALSHAAVVVGNSSSGLYEAPSFKVPTVDIGDRQKGRLAAASVIRCAATATAITGAINRALELDCSGVVNPYGDGRAAGRIVQALRDAPPRETLLKKHFHCLEVRP